jgi:hypothetical protein
MRRNRAEAIERDREELQEKLARALNDLAAVSEMNDR